MLEILTFSAVVCENSNYLLGKFGAYVSFYLITKTIGVFAIVIPFILLAIAYAMFFKKNILKYLIKSSKQD